MKKKSKLLPVPENIRQVWDEMKRMANNKEFEELSVIEEPEFKNALYKSFLRIEALEGSYIQKRKQGYDKLMATQLPPSSTGGVADNVSASISVVEVNPIDNDSYNDNNNDNGNDNDNEKKDASFSDSKPIRVILFFKKKKKQTNSNYIKYTNTQIYK
ncbi:hypothetical protein RFI_21341 [Reticulomyxa filosa]|uniref:Uncharacterized protein n=1 Tax=Reticulomyxa filosa TaxID=46433 RepID=X6MQA1_RETFI|nr:hypothetical protein RFI_21341 [Reticulomyxa filosa]|eukprot:ETO16019.1 hypothetical protein RFI_21341 [Reticulomyxa filosa]